MNLVDSSGWFEYLADGKNADSFLAPLTDVVNLIVPTICIYEVFKVVFREKGEHEALQTVALMKQGNVIDLSFEISVQAAKFSVEKKIPMADSIIYTTARINKAIIWTQDDDFKNLPSVKYFSK
ncbi:type II toxin-antitoxin system VapC family toxin [bacterium]|nr:type II toxin-antitoxin system VapC family toxin [bacterium]MBU1063207.1 type II toxin-antitoxin system VapC family toxin [bacterium]MBU1635581.1 type II toxin-antitoxin system VapC family toxin [bacterium]MBU1873739.1 type II toxin-antitoxin system VapC family toxin [bacterium]